MVNDKYGTDAVRFGLLVSAAPGNDIALSEEVILRGRKFANKIWNASRLLFSKDQGAGSRASSRTAGWEAASTPAIDKANRAFEHHRYHEAADAAVALFLGRILRLVSGTEEVSRPTGASPIDVHEKAMLLLHPLMPFITEELWHRRGHETRSRWSPIRSMSLTLNDADAEREMKLLQDIVTACASPSGS